MKKKRNGPLGIDRKRFREIAEQQKAAKYESFSKDEEKELVKWAKESQTDPDLRPWRPKEKNLARKLRLLRENSRSLARLICLLFGHKWIYTYFIGGRECLRCGKYQTEDDLFKESLKKRESEE